MVSAQAPLAADVQLVVVGVPRDADIVGTPAKVRSVAWPLVLELVVVQLLFHPLHEEKLDELGVDTVHPLWPETVQVLATVGVVTVEVAV
jgi:hypothetical protein